MNKQKNAFVAWLRDDAITARARLLGVSRRTIYKWLDRECCPSALTMLKISRASKGVVKYDDVLSNYLGGKR